MSQAGLQFFACEFATSHSDSLANTIPYMVKQDETLPVGSWATFRGFPLMPWSSNVNIDFLLPGFRCGSNSWPDCERGWPEVPCVLVCYLSVWQHCERHFVDMLSHVRYLAAHGPAAHNDSMTVMLILIMVIRLLLLWSHLPRQGRCA